MYPNTSTVRVQGRVGPYPTLQGKQTQKKSTHRFLALGGERCDRSQKVTVVNGERINGLFHLPINGVFLGIIIH